MARTPRAITRTIQVLEAASPINAPTSGDVIGYRISADDRDECLKALKRADARTRIDPSARTRRRRKRRRRERDVGDSALALSDRRRIQTRRARSPQHQTRSNVDYARACS